ncbi:WhiB family transcriptional regulator [Mycolicibacterium obuense]|uniref:Transcriptional regulator WhiB n=1 Tax=Mycolicibacterium obuense TaxID=1807 RepID=A0A0J6W878_9MYCO|nr:WhiB family transcriptional regulator [Mycolicibacterium obuense]KMO77832.1 Redox-responsive transcriptional regulator WhiB3 [Mycolicibacterium obuense]
MTAALPIDPPDGDEYWSWQFQGRCLDFPSDLFFPESERRSERRRREEEAKRICRTCPVLMRCREHALSVPERYGVWGATTPRERGIAPAHRKVRGNVR